MAGEEEPLVEEQQLGGNIFRDFPEYSPEDAHRRIRHLFSETQGLKVSGRLESQDPSDRFELISSEAGYMIAHTVEGADGSKDVYGVLKVNDNFRVSKRHLDPETGLTDVVTVVIPDLDAGPYISKAEFNSYNSAGEKVEHSKRLEAPQSNAVLNIVLDDLSTELEFHEQGTGSSLNKRVAKVLGLVMPEQPSESEAPESPPAA